MKTIQTSLSICNRTSSLPAPAATSCRRLPIIAPLKGFTKFSRVDYVQLKQENKIVPDGVNAKLLGCHGPLANRKPGQAFLQAA